MASILSTIARALRDNVDGDRGVHFHAGGLGRAYPCHDPRCVSPGLDPNDAHG